jgi:hypothetical protein
MKKIKKIYTTVFDVSKLNDVRLLEFTISYKCCGCFLEITMTKQNFPINVFDKLFFIL